VDKGGNLKPRDILDLVKSLNKQLNVIKYQICNMEKARLSEKMPRDVKYLTKTEAELKRELCVCIEEAEDLMAV
jgi:hypothetical protein